MVIKNPKEARRRKIRYRIRKKIVGTAACPRLSLYKSNTAFYAQVIDDQGGKTLLAVDTRSLGGKKLEHFVKAGEILAQKALEKGISKIVFDRSGYLYVNKIKAFSEAASRAGLKH